jgi:hypothetical protein
MDENLVAHARQRRPEGRKFNPNSGDNKRPQLGRSKALQTGALTENRFASATSGSMLAA